MLPLRFPKLWSAFGWLLVAGVVVGSLVPSDTIQAITLNDKVMHAAAYFSLMVWFAGLYRPALYPAIAAILVTLGLSLDLLQSLTETRSLELYDVIVNSAGVVAGCAISYWLLGGWCQRLEQRLLS